MTDDSFVVEEIDVEQAPGFETGRLPIKELSPGINVVHGPNASGKTTLARSIQWLLWPEECADRASLIGRLSANGDDWRVDVDRGRTRYQRNGQDANGPNLPPADRRDRYHLALHDLLQHDTRNESFARTIKRESAGGYDIAAARDELGFSEPSSTRGLSVVKEAEQAIESVREADAEVKDLRKEQSRLDRLERQLTEAKGARDRVELLDQAIDLADAQTDLKAAESKLDEFPDVLGDLTGDEAEAVDDLTARIDDWEEKRAEANATISDAHTALADANLPDDGVEAGTIDRLKALRDEYDDLAAEKRQAEVDLRDAKGQRENALTDVPLDLEETDLAELDSDAWEVISDVAREGNRVDAERKAHGAVDRWLDGDDRPDPELSTLERGSQALEHWLASQSTDETAGTNSSTLVLVSAALLALTGGLLAALVNPLLAVIVLVAAGIAWHGYQNRGHTESTDASETHRRTFDELEINNPESWSESPVRDRLHDIYDAIGQHKVADRREHVRNTLSKDVDELEQRENTLEDRRSELREQLGVAPETTDIELLAVVKGILRWQNHDDRVAGLNEQIESLDEQIESLQTELRHELEPYGYDDISDVEHVTAHIRDLEERQSTYETATSEIERAESTIEEAEERIADLEQERTAIFEKADLADDQTDELRAFCEQVDDYREAVEHRNSVEHLVENERTELEAYPNYDPSLEAREAPALEQEKREFEETANEHDELSSQITKIETKISEAKRSTQLEDALADKERALTGVADQLEGEYDAAVGNVLADHVQESAHESSRPDVFERAGEILTRITRGRYRLDIEEDTDTFRAFDTVTERGHALSELSSATRLQVLLAVRVAFVEQQEQGAQLPLVLDETLANSDDEKATVVIESMIELARDGRQVFYFTAQGDEVAKWLAATAEADVECTEIDLASVRDLDGTVDIPDLDDIAEHSTTPPAPDGHDHESYRDELSNAGFDPRRGAGHTHVWYVVDDVELLYHILDLGITRWGQLRNLLARTDGSVLSDDPDTLAEIERNGAALERFVNVWQRGRGERVDRQALEDTDAVTTHFIDEVTELAEKYDGDGERIIAALRDREVDGFRIGKMDDLEQYFEENGYIEPTDTFEPAEIRARVMQVFLDDDVDREDASEQADRFLSRLSSSTQ